MKKFNFSTLLALTFFLSIENLRASDAPSWLSEHCQVEFANLSDFPSYSRAQVLSASDIHYKTFGNLENPALVLVHGLGSSLETWVRYGTAQRLSEDYFVVAYDQRGHGQTGARYQTNYSAQMMAEDLDVLLNHLKIKKTFLVGHSMGGRTVLKFASLFPSKVEGVLVEDMHAKGLKKQREQALNAYKTLFYIKDQIEKGNPRSEEELFSLLASLGFDPRRAIPSMLQQIVLRDNAPIEFDQNFFSTRFYSTQGLMEDLTEALKSISVPLHFLAASDPEERVLFGVGVEHLRDNKPEATLVEIPDSDHSIHVSAADAFEDYIKSVFQ